VVAAQKMYFDQAGATVAPAGKLEDQLDNRFHQNFHTTAMTEAPAAHLLLPIMISILVGAPDTGGNDLAAAAIPAQGAQPDDEYLATLIALSGLSTAELRARFRISFDRAPGETTNPVQLNVDALLGLLTDTWQSPQEPFNPPPVIAGNGYPLVFGDFDGRAPFFLEYEEWLARQTFYPENVYNIRSAIPNFGGSYLVDMLKEKAGVAKLYGTPDFYADQNELNASIDWIAQWFAVPVAFNTALESLDSLEYSDAIKQLDPAAALIWNAIVTYPAKWIHDRFNWLWSNGVWDTQKKVNLKDRANLGVKSQGI
jgi:hypothetical protein